MAKTKKKVEKKKIELRHIEDPRHGWVEVPETLSNSLGLLPAGGPFAYRNGMLYMEEDCEAADLDKALKKHGYDPHYVSCYVDDFDSWLDGSDWWPAIPPIGHGRDRIEGTVGKPGDLVFWDGKRPWWIVEWQPDNGEVFVIVNSDGDIGTAMNCELTRDFRKVR